MKHQRMSMKDIKLLPKLVPKADKDNYKMFDKYNNKKVSLNLTRQGSVHSSLENTSERVNSEERKKQIGRYV